MKKTLTILSLMALMAGGLFAATTQNVNMTVNLSAWYDLSVGTSSLTFNDVQPAISATPGTQTITAAEGAVAVRAFAVTKISDTLKLYVVANSDLTAGSTTIGIDAITWTASGSGYAGGTMAKTSVEAGSWGSAVLHWHQGSFTYSFLRDYVNQAPGAYTATATYTLSSI
jgi:hypothetical protein